jgi:two-component system sensor kinase FixL
MQELQSEVFHMSRFTAMGEMAANLAHEINQPLAAIVNYLKGSSRILERMKGPQMVMLRDALKGAAGQALRAGNVIRHLREFMARGESERAIEELQGLVEDAAQLALVGAKDSGIEVTFEFAHRTSCVLVNRTQIQQILLNLIRNAVEAMEHAGTSRLVIRTRDVPSQSLIQVSVVDTGSGISPEGLDRLFKPFTTTKRSGMGVGLSICRKIIEAHGGKIWAESVVGKGSTFHFTLQTVEKDEIPDDPCHSICRAAEV